jgi:hypothetical protein
VGERKLFEKSFSFPHTPFLSKTLKKGFLLYNENPAIVKRGSIEALPMNRM